MIEYLYAQGHRKIGLIRGASQTSPAPVCPV